MRPPAMIAALSHIRNWIFDLDHTLYPPSAALFALIDARMTAYIADRLSLERDEAFALQKRYFRDHGTTLAGLIADHGTDPHEFLEYVHDVTMDRLTVDPALVAGLSTLNGRRIVFTNGSADYARRVLHALGLSHLFDVIFDIHRMDYRPKPFHESYQNLCAALAIDPRESLFVEDMVRNLRPAKMLGMTTIWLNNGSELGNAGFDPAIIDYEIDNLARWLEQIQAGTN